MTTPPLTFGAGCCPLCRQALQVVQGTTAPAWRCGCNQPFAPVPEEAGERAPAECSFRRPTSAGHREPRVIKVHQPARRKDGAA